MHTLTRLLIISINQRIRYLSKVYCRASAVLGSIGHFRKSSHAFHCQDIISLLGGGRDFTKLMLDFILHMNLWELGDILAALE